MILKELVQTTAASAHKHMHENQLALGPGPMAAAVHVGGWNHCRRLRGTGLRLQPRALLVLALAAVVVVVWAPCGVCQSVADELTALLDTERVKESALLTPTQEEQTAVANQGATTASTCHG